VSKLSIDADCKAIYFNADLKSVYSYQVYSYRIPIQ